MNSEGRVIDREETWQQAKHVFKVIIILTYSQAEDYWLPWVLSRMDIDYAHGD